MTNQHAQVSWTAVQASDLFSWFNMSETNRQAVGADLTTVGVAPGAFQECIDLSFDVEPGGEVVAFGLALDRNWLDGAGTGMTDGADLLASVARTFASVDPVLDEVAEAVMAGGFAASRSPVILRAGSEPRPSRTPEIAALVATFTDGSAPPSTVLGRRALCTANIRHDSREWFTAAWL